MYIDIDVDGHSKSSNLQQQAPSQDLQPAAATPIGTVSNAGTLAQYRFGWQQALLAVGLLAISGAGTALVFKVLGLEQYPVFLNDHNTYSANFVSTLTILIHCMCTT